MAFGLGTFWLLHYWLTDLAAVITASFPAIFVSGSSYLLLTLGAGFGRRSRTA
jgi:hypothetical protein